MMILQPNNNMLNFALGKWLLIVALFAGIFNANAQLNLPYSFDFSTDPFANGWTQVSVSGAQSWQYNATFQNATMSAFASGCQVNEDWLISPSFNLENSTDESLTFDIQRGFSGDNGLEVFYSTNYSGSGDPNEADWTFIDEAVTTDFANNNVSVTFGPYDVLNGVNESNVYIAFRFAWDEGDCSTWRVAGLNLISGSIPVIAASVTAISGLNYEEAEGPSESVGYEMTIANFEGNGTVSVTAPTGFEISKNDVTFTPTLSFDYTNGDLTEPGLIYVRLAEGLSPANYTGLIAHTSGSVNANVSVSGVVSLAPPTDAYFINFEGEGETKGAYASGNVVLSGLEWNMTDVLIGTDDADFKNGIRSARLRGYGSTMMAMQQDKNGGAGTITFLHRRYGTDQQVAYLVEYSTNGGGSWIPAGPEFTSGPQVQTYSAQVNVAGNVRFRIGTVSATGNTIRRMNIDDIIISDFGGSGGVASITADANALVPFSYTEGQGPSAEGMYSISAENLSPESGTIAVAAPTGFELSNDGFTWTISLNVAYTNGGSNIDNNTIMVRLAEGLNAGNYGGNITHNGGGASANVPVSGSVSSDGVSFLPETYNLSSGTYTFNEWDSLASPLTYPANMRYYWSNNPSGSEFDDLEDGTGVYDCGFNLSSRPRINGLGEDGFSFISTGNPQRNDCEGGDADEDRYVGSAVLALNTTGVTVAHIAWKSWLVSQGERTFGIRLQYRIGGDGAYVDFEEETTFSSAGLESGVTEDFVLELPTTLLGQAAVYLRFVYFQIDGESGNRPELAIESFTVCPCEPLSTVESVNGWVRAYPNPTADILLLDLSDAPQGTYNLNLFDLSGKLVKSTQAVGNGQTLRFDLNSIPQGMYFLTAVNMQGEAYTVKVIKR